MLTMVSRLEDQEQTIRDYKQRLSDLEHRLAVQERTTNDYKQGVADLERRLAVQEKTTNDCKKKVIDLEQTMTQLKLNQDLNVDDDPKVSTSDGNKVPGITKQGRSEKVKTRSAPLWQKRALLNTKGPVAFHAIIRTNPVEHLGRNQNIVFPDILANLGGGYHNQHGIFITPKPGVYIFSVSIMAKDMVSHDEIYVHLKKNGQIIANVYAHADSSRFDQGSVTVVTQLAAADEIWVSLYGPGVDVTLVGDSYSSFMGCLVIPM